jgi:uncharacterized glyoxalase superfamily protein PhnB
MSARRELFPILACRDLGRTRDFYASVLGGSERYRFPDEGEPVYLTLRVGDSTLGLAAAPRHGGALVADAADMPWGERVGWIRDPEGVHVLVIQAVA